MEIMGLHLPGSSFVNPNTQLRELLNEEITKRIVELAKENRFENTLAAVVSEKSIVNAIIGLLATGGSTNHTIHLIAMAKAAGVIINWEDFSELSSVIPLITRVYPNGAADVNHFHAAGGMGYVIRTLLDANLLHEDVATVFGFGLRNYTKEPRITGDGLTWVEGTHESLNSSILRSENDPFQKDGGIRMLSGNIGRAVIKVSAVELDNRVIEAPAIVFDEQIDLITAFKKGELEKDFIAVLPFQGPKQNGMPELHQLTPTLTVLQKKGYKVGLITDGRMSGASGKIPAAIHVVPEARDGGAIGLLKTGDLIRLDAEAGTVECLSDLSGRTPRTKSNVALGSGRELFAIFRDQVNSSEEGASII
jgi:phosphogluconate dehydratase